MAPNLSDLFSPSSPSPASKDSYPVHNFQPKGHVIENLARDRLRAFTSGGQFSYLALFNVTNYSGVNLPPLMFDGRESGKEYVTLEGITASPRIGIHALQKIELIELVASPPGLTRPPFHEAIQLPFRECTKGESFGPSWSTHWFRITLKLPKHFLEKVHHP
jgi:alpha-mannosidase